MDQVNFYLKRAKLIIRAILDMGLFMAKTIFIKLKNTNTQEDFLKVRKMEKDSYKSNRNNKKIRNYKKYFLKSMKECGKMIGLFYIKIFTQGKNDINFFINA